MYGKERRQVLKTNQTEDENTQELKTERDKDTKCNIVEFYLQY